MSFKPRTGWLIVVLLIALPIFSHLDDLPLIQWDEARLANNALEMYHNGNPIVTFYNGKPDMWNTKPPLMIWLQVVCMHLVGINELAVRLPSALAALATCLLLYWFPAYKMRRPMLGLLSVLVLITSEGYVRYHVIRTGDDDSLLVLFMLAASLFFFTFLEAGEQRPKRLYLFFAALTLAFLTKGIPALIFTPALLLYAGWRRKLLPLLRNRHAYFGVLGFLFVTAGYYLLREHYNPGYLKAVLYNDITGRYLATDTDNGTDIDFYLHYLADRAFSFWYLLIIPGIIIGVVQADDELRRLAVFASILAVFHFAVISLARTKNDWYDAAIYPFWAIIVALLLYSTTVLLSRHLQTAGILRKNLLPVALLVLIFTMPYARVLGIAIQPPHINWVAEDDMCVYLKALYHDPAGKPEAVLAWESPAQNVVWYLRRLKETGRPVKIVGAQALRAGERVMAYQARTKAYIETHYQARILKTANAVTIYQIDSLH